MVQNVFKWNITTQKMQIPNKQENKQKKCYSKIIQVRSCEILLTVRLKIFVQLYTKLPLCNEMQTTLI